MEIRKAARNAPVIGLYLGAIVAANLLAARFGPSITVVNAFLFIGLDITARDRLHEVWHGNRLVLKMALLVIAGSLLSWVINKDAKQIAMASAVAFGLAAITDTIVYSMLYSKEWFTKVNGSNIASAIVDSIAFPTLAFGGFMPLITLGQAVAKIAGGGLWSLILRRDK